MILIDGKRLTELMIEHGVGVRSSRMIEFKRLDEDFFYCEIQPNVLTSKSCAGGGAGEGGMCHDSRSALLLVDTMSGPPDCTDGVVTGGTIPTDYLANFEAIRFTVQSDVPTPMQPRAYDGSPELREYDWGAGQPPWFDEEPWQLEATARAIS